MENLNLRIEAALRVLDEITHKHALIPLHESNIRLNVYDMRCILLAIKSPEKPELKDGYVPSELNKPTEVELKSVRDHEIIGAVLEGKPIMIYGIEYKPSKPLHTEEELNHVIWKVDESIPLSYRRKVAKAILTYLKERQ